VIIKRLQTRLARTRPDDLDEKPEEARELRLNGFDSQSATLRARNPLRTEIRQHERATGPLLLRRSRFALQGIDPAIRVNFVP